MQDDSAAAGSPGQVDQVLDQSPAHYLDWFTNRFQTVNETAVCCPFCKQVVLKGKDPKEADQFLAAMYGCRCGRFITALFQEPLTQRQWGIRVEPLQPDRTPKEPIGQVPESPARLSRSAQGSRLKSSKGKDSGQPENAVLVPARAKPDLTFAAEAAQVKALHHDLWNLGVTMLTRMIAAGEILARVKAGLPHGHWQPWVKEYLPEISYRTVARYLESYRRRDDQLRTDDPVLFLAEINGNASKVLEDREQLTKATSTSLLPESIPDPTSDPTPEPVSEVVNKINQLHKELWEANLSVSGNSPHIDPPSEQNKSTPAGKKPTAKRIRAVRKLLAAADSILETPTNQVHSELIPSGKPPGENRKWFGLTRTQLDSLCPDCRKVLEES
jgi:hypothetical protein